MPFTPTSSAREVARRLDPLQSQIQGIYDRLGYPQFDDLKGNELLEDVRAFSLMACKAEITSNILVLNILAKMTEGLFSIDTWRLIIGLDDKTVPLEWVTDKLSDYMRLSLATMFQFRVENMIVNILNIINSNIVSRSYSMNAKNLLNVISIEERDGSLDTLMILQNIRNSLHSNGIHNNRKLTRTIDECTFDFQQGQPVSCASWAHIIVAAKATIDVLEKMLNAPEIKAIPQPITDRYIEQTR